jgi:hypothetical protein
VLILASQPTQRAAHEKHERAGRLDQSQGRIAAINRSGRGDPLPGKPERGDVLRRQARAHGPEARRDIVGGGGDLDVRIGVAERPASPAPLDEARILEARRSARRIAQPGVAQRDPVSSCEGPGVRGQRHFQATNPRAATATRAAAASRIRQRVLTRLSSARVACDRWAGFATAHRSLRILLWRARGRRSRRLARRTRP